MVHLGEGLYWRSFSSMDITKEDTMKTIDKQALTQEEQLEITLQGKDPNEYIALDIVAMGMQMQPQTAKVKEEHGSETSHNCIICTIPFPLPLNPQVLMQKKVIVPTMNGEDSGSLEIALGGIPKVRIVMKRDALVDSLKE